MGLLGGAFRVASGVGRTSYRVGRSVASGRVPSLGVGLSIPGGLGVRVGTRGVSIRTPIARQSIGLSGFRTTIGVPGIAHIRVNPTRPSVKVGIGPAAATIAKHPGVSLATRFVAVGVTTRPLMWARVGPVRVKIPGQVQRSARRPWHEEVDDQWQEYYERRPPSISEQLHDMIREIEEGAIAAARQVNHVPRPTAIPRPYLHPDDVKRHRKATRKDSLNGVGIFARRKRKAAKATAVARHTQWVEEEQRALDVEHARLSSIMTATFNAWQAGDSPTMYVIANAMLAATGGHASLVSLTDGVATIVVFGLSLDDVHPCKPTYTAGGAPTVKKRTKNERLDAHDTLVGASVVTALSTIWNALPGIKKAEVVVIEMSEATRSLGEASVLAVFSINRDAPALDPYDMGLFIADNEPARSTSLDKVLSGSFRGSDDDLAVASYCESLDDLRQPDFWLEASAAAAALTPSATVRATPADKPILEQRAADRRRTATPAAPLKSNSVIKHPASPSGRSRPATQESSLTDLLSRSEQAVRTANADAALHCWSELLKALPNLPAVNAAEAEDIARELAIAIAALGLRSDVASLDAILPMLALALQSRLKPVVKEIVAMLDDVDILIDHIREHPSCLQSKLGAALGIDKLRVRQLLWYLTHFGRVDRVEQGNSYLLTLNDED